MPIETPDSDLSTNEETCPDQQCCHNTATVRRETLTSRAKRIIGRPIDSPERKKNKNQPKIPKEASSKRREQVLQAQRTHRQRTQGYIKELEKEVLALRDHEVQCKTATEHNGRLLQRIAKLENLLRRHNIIIDDEAPEHMNLDMSQTVPHTPIGMPSPFLSNVPTLSPLSTVGQNMTDLTLTTPPTSTSSLSSTVDANQNLFINLDFSAFFPMPTDQFPDMLHNDDRVPIFSTPDTLDPCHVHTSTLEDPEMVSQQGIDFVLALERVCFTHLNFAHYSGAEDQLSASALSPTTPTTQSTMSLPINGGLGHAYSAVVNLIHHRHHAQPPSTSNVPSEMPKPDVEKLFRSTLHVDHSPSVTPYQIWANLVRIRSEGCDVCPERVNSILLELQKYVRCAGFGAAVDKSIVDQLLHCFYPGQYYRVTW